MDIGSEISKNVNQNGAKIFSKKKRRERNAAGPQPVSIASLPPVSCASWANVLKKGVQPTKTSSQDVAGNETNCWTNGSTNIWSETPKALAEIKAPAATSQQNDFNDPALHRMGELLFNYQLDQQTVSRLSRGLTNGSNYCYIHSILQALLACPPFYNLLMALPCRTTATKSSKTPLIDNMARFVREFSPLNEWARMGRKKKSYRRGRQTGSYVDGGNAFVPSYVYTMLKNSSYSKIFSVEGQQEDAEEFLSCLLNGISGEMLEAMKLVSTESNDTASDEGERNVNFNNNDDESKVTGPKNKGSITQCTEFDRTPLSDIFRGQLRSRVLRTGQEPSDSLEPFFTLQLDIKKAQSVEDALETLVAMDPIEGMTCTMTKKPIEAWKQVTLEKLPVVLVLHLKSYDYNMNRPSKIMDCPQFPIDLILDNKLMSPAVGQKFAQESCPKEKQYQLFAVTYHVGWYASKGHYVTDAFHVDCGQWIRYDDSSVESICEADVLNPSLPRVPYLLYYRRCDTIENNQPPTNLEHIQ